MNLSLTIYFLLFIIYSIAGWLLEVTCKYIDYKKFINRGFLIGPYCPIYGYGAVFITLALYKYQEDPLVLFIMTVVSCGVLEYLTSWFMEKLFKARWWDYSSRKFNLNGRVCLGTLVPFGVFGIILTYITNPFLIGLLSKANQNILNIIAVVIFIIYMTDYVISTIIIFGFRKTTVKVGKENIKDNTEDITNKVRAILSQKAWAYRRLINAYPTLVTIRTRIQEFTDDVKENVNEIKDNINEKAEDFRNAINDKKEEIKNNITEKTNYVKNTFMGTKKYMSDEVDYRKRKIRVVLRLSKRRFKNDILKK